MAPCPCVSRGVLGRTPVTHKGAFSGGGGAFSTSFFRSRSRRSWWLVGWRRSPSTSGRVRASSDSSESRSGDDDSDDPYLVLGVAENASMDEIKAAYKALMRKKHPDLNPNDADSSEAVELNMALDALTSRRGDVDRALAKQRNDRSTRKSAKSATIKAEEEGLVLVQQEEIVFREMRTPASESAKAEMDDVDIPTFLQQWASTMAFTAEDPLPVPCQSDNVEEGVRLTFVGVTRGRVVPQGELWIRATRCGDDSGEVDVECDAAGGGSWRINVSRKVSPTPKVDYPMAGEKEVLRRLRAALKAKFEVDALNTGPATWEDGPVALATEAIGRASALFTQWLPAPPDVLENLGLGDDDRLVSRSKGYESYVLKKKEGDGV